MNVRIKIPHLLILALFVFHQSSFFWVGFQKADTAACSPGEMGSCCRSSGNDEMRCNSGELAADEGMCYVASSCQNDSGPNMVAEIVKPFLSASLCDQMSHNGKSLNVHYDLEIYSDVKLPCREKPPRSAQV